ncbi:type II secretion system minor pseudopilin GspJ [Salinisphaera aquimarina]|uniref:Type II secretion system protein J n=1 Tax=Salinisphaera aquimarina TaxID=2094031 RepID=A0ABV7ESH1_9GAMM
MNPRNRQQGFTLVELLIAIAIFVVMAAMAYGGLSAVISSRETVTAALDRSKTMQMAVWRIGNDLEQIVNRPIRDSFGDSQPALAGSPDVGIQFTRNGWRNPLGEIRSSLQRVAYRVDEDDNLVRDYWRVLDQAQDSVPVESTLVEEVSNVEWRFLDSDRQWQDRWPPNGGLGAAGAATSGLPSDVASAQYDPPLAIELRFTAPAWGDVRLLYMVPGADK